MQSVFVLREPELKAEPYIPRAMRFEIPVPLLYRERGKAVWHEGRVVNISRTGVFFEGELDLKLKTVIELQVSFPPEITGGNSVNVQCWGPIVRKESSQSEDAPLAMAASISHYRLRPK